MFSRFKKLAVEVSYQKLKINKDNLKYVQENLVLSHNKYPDRMSVGL